MKDNKDEPFSFLEGGTLAAITFIWNYYQLTIGTETVSIYSDPAVIDTGKTIYKDDAAYRNALCARIGKQVVGADSNTECLRLSFSDGSIFQISLRQQDRVEATLQESLVVTNYEGNILVVGDSQV